MQCSYASPSTDGAYSNHRQRRGRGLRGDVRVGPKLKPAALGAEELTPEELPFLRFDAEA